METTETAITNRVGANSGKRISKTFDRASWSMAHRSVPVGPALQIFWFGHSTACNKLCVVGVR